MDGNIVTLIQIVVTIIIAFITAILTNSNEKKAELAGGIILVLMGIKILVEHLGIL